LVPEEDEFEGKVSFEQIQDSDFQNNNNNNNMLTDKNAGVIYPVTFK